MLLCQACTSTPTHAIASSGPFLANSRGCTATEKLLADSCSTHTRQLTRLNSISSLWLLIIEESTIIMFWSGLPAAATDPSASEGMHFTGIFWDNDPERCPCKMIYFIQPKLCSFTLILDEHSFLEPDFVKFHDLTISLQHRKSIREFDLMAEIWRIQTSQGRCNLPLYTDKYLWFRDSDGDFNLRTPDLVDFLGPFKDGAYSLLTKLI